MQMVYNKSTEHMFNPYYDKVQSSKGDPKGGLKGDPIGNSKGGPKRIQTGIQKGFLKCIKYVLFVKVAFLGLRVC
jgi:hypothetical protein